jgi:hypothetical protein
MNRGNEQGPGGPEEEDRMQDLQAIVTLAVAKLQGWAVEEVAGNGWQDWQDADMWKNYVATLKTAAGWVGQVDGQPAAVVTVAGPTGGWTYKASEALDQAVVELYPADEGGMIGDTPMGTGAYYTPPAAA